MLKGVAEFIGVGRGCCCAQVLVAEGEPVQAGAPLVVLEAMKMEHTVVAPCAGTVSPIRRARWRAGQQTARYSQSLRWPLLRMPQWQADSMLGSSQTAANSVGHARS